MFSRLVKWHQEMELEGLRVLENPELAEDVKPGLRRIAARQLAGMTPIERQQIAAFSRKYWGWRAYAALAKFLLPFILAGGLVHLIWPKIPLWLGLVVGGVAGLELLVVGVTAWFAYSKFTGANTLRWICKTFGILLAFGLIGFAMGAIDQESEVTLRKLAKGIPILIGAIAGLFALFGLPVLVVGNMRAREAQLLAQDMTRQATQEKLERQLSEAQLRLLRAQIEPHFLFNTLGAVQQLAEEGAPRAAALTADLIAFLRATSSEMRRESNTLREEFRLTQAYLNVMQARMGKRLQYSIDLPEALAEKSIPSMTVLTLAENAIKHGIEPSLRGGMVTVSAHLDGDMLLVRVSDNGAGMAPVPGKGMGLENVRSRLTLIHGSAARLNLMDGENGGVSAEMVMPGVAA
jgi:signal transduction histidine kinase